MMRSSKAPVVVLLLGSLALYGCDDPSAAKEDNPSMMFGSYEECSVNIGPENCQKEAVTQKQVTTTDAQGHSSTTFIPIFMPMNTYHGGYLDSAPRRAPTYVPSQPIFSASPSVAKAAAAGSGISTPSASARGGFGATAAAAHGGGGE